MFEVGRVITLRPGRYVTGIPCDAGTKARILGHYFDLYVIQLVDHQHSDVRGEALTWHCRPEWIQGMVLFDA